MTRNLILSGGIYHPFTETSTAVADQLAALEITSEITGVAEGLRRMQNEAFDLVTINALAFTMTQADKYAPLRAEFAFDIDEQGKRALREHLNARRGLLGLHTAAICFDTWPEWGDLLGAAWIWGQSNHPAPGYLTVTHGARSFQVWDELYCGLQLQPETRVLATARPASGGEDQPILTAKENAVYFALGHDLTSVMSSDYAELLRLAARRAMSPTGKVT
ncbi:MAG: ThuA domain-containing protein [Alphaproteobacteria bacterium]|nr:ThuA domain-containing protein [Alphaproteobacteria bacterium]